MGLCCRARGRAAAIPTQVNISNDSEYKSIPHLLSGAVLPSGEVLELGYLVTAFFLSHTACLASSAGSRRHTTVCWTSPNLLKNSLTMMRFFKLVGSSFDSSRIWWGKGPFGDLAMLKSMKVWSFQTPVEVVMHSC